MSGAGQMLTEKIRPVVSAVLANGDLAPTASGATGGTMAARLSATIL